MEKIPTAEEFLDLQHKNVPSIEFDIREAMIEFAKLHVEACKKDIINNVETSLGGDGSPLVSIVSILNSYPLSKIK
jgi:hypothetical protein